MHTFLSFLTLTHISLFLVHGFPSLNVDRPASESSPKLEPRQNIPEIPPKPATSDSGSFHGSQFVFLEQTDYAPAVDAMPVWVYSRTQKEFVRRLESSLHFTGKASSTMPQKTIVLLDDMLEL